MEDFQSKVLASEDNGTQKPFGNMEDFQGKVLASDDNGTQKPFGNMEDFQSKVLASDGVVENPQNKDQLEERAKYWHGKMTVSRKLFGKYGGPSEPSTEMGRRRYPRRSLANMEDFHFQNKVLALEDDGIQEILGQIWRTFSAKYWHGKMTVSQKLFGKYG